MDLPNDSQQPDRRLTDRRLNSWKSIGAFFERDERTVKRWEVQRGLPVHRVPGAGRSGVYAYTTELAEWLKTADTQSPVSDLDEAPPPESAIPSAVVPSPLGSARTSRRRTGIILVSLMASLAILATSFVVHRRYFSARPMVAAALPAGPKASASSEAQDLYLQGLYHWNKRTPQDLNQAVDNFTQAIVRDPKYAPAYAGLANCYNLLREYTVMPASEAYPRAIAAAQRAIALDDSLAEAHNSLAFADFYWSWDAAGAEREFRRAIELDPNSVLGHHWYATFLMTIGRAQEALAEIEIARKLDPQSSAILADKGLILFSAGQNGQAIALLKQIEATDPTFLSPPAYLTVIYLEIKNYRDYLEEARKTALLLHDQDRLRILAAGEKGFAAGGGPGMLRSMLPVQQELYAKGRLEAYELASTYCLLGDKQRALSLLQVSVEKREALDVALRVDQNLETLHDDPTFRKLIARVGLPPPD
jgi:Tfp pilus assembly protein PilF